MKSAAARVRAGLTFLAAAVAAAPEPALAVSPKYWIHDSAADFLQGRAAGVSVVSDGSLRLAPKLDVVAQPEVPYLWDIALDARGRIYAGSGDEGWILRITENRAENFFRCDAIEVLALAVAPDGTIFAGTAPDGLVYRVGADGKGEVLFDVEETYVWDLELAADGSLWAAVGPGAAIYRWSPGASAAERVLDLDDDHVVCLAIDPKGGVVFGTEGRGLVGRLDEGRRARVLHDCAEGEVSAVLCGADGTVWAAASSAAESREAAGSQPPDSTADGSARPDGSTPDEEGGGSPYIFQVKAIEEGKGVLYRIDAEGTAARFWESGQGAILHLADAGAGDVLAATGDDGRLVRVHSDGTATLLVDAAEEHVVAAVRDEARHAWWIATANPAHIDRMADEIGAQGTYVSQVLDANRPATWGRIEWAGETGGEVSFAVRSGNTGEPDGTWTDWSAELRDVANALKRDKSRFLQWRATLSGKSPNVRRVRVSSRETNVAPIVLNVEVIPAGTRFYDEEPEARPRPLYQSLPGGVNVQYNFESAPGQFPPEQRAAWTQGLRQIRWESADPNGDPLLIDLSYRREDETEWKVFGDDVEGNAWTFNSNGVPDGPYYIRVTASDRRGNPYDELTTSRDSEIFLVDNTHPAFRDVTWRRDGDSIRIGGVLEDATSDVVRLETSVNGGDWEDRPPGDTLFDSRSEPFDVRVDVKGKGEHAILLRGTDLAGNLAATRVLVRP